VNFFVYLKICQILHHEYTCLLDLIFIVFFIKINYNTSIEESGLLAVPSVNCSNLRNTIVSVKDKNIE